jgi:hypothetical protein
MLDHVRIVRIEHAAGHAELHALFGIPIVFLVDRLLDAGIYEAVLDQEVLTASLQTWGEMIPALTSIWCACADFRFMSAFSVSDNCHCAPLSKPSSRWRHHVGLWMGLSRKLPNNQLRCVHPTTLCRRTSSRLRWTATMPIGRRSGMAFRSADEDDRLRTEFRAGKAIAAIAARRFRTRASRRLWQSQIGDRPPVRCSGPPPI